jgi:DNA-binding response OmpR family regulator
MVSRRIMMGAISDAQGCPNEVRTVPQSGREGEETKVVVLCLDERYRTTLARWLLSDGMRVEIADGGRRAKELLGAGKRRVLLVTDRVLPPWPGLPRLAALKRSSAQLRIVAIDKGDSDSRYVAFAAGADAVISPPLRRDEVMRAIRVAEG